MIVKECKLTTFDNPFDVFEQFDSWFLYDNEKGYNSCGKVDRLATITDEMTEFEELKEIERAIDLIIEHDFTNTYKKVSRNLTYPD